MITVKLMGGMGNTMFQYAYGLALEDRGYPVQFDKSALVEGTHREYSLDYFVDLPFGTPSGPVIIEKNLRFDSNNMSPKSPSTMLGYWQSERYFENVQDKVRKLFRFKPPSEHLTRLIQEMRNSESVFVHVRRQDYVNLQHFHGLPTIEYYYKALALMPFTKKAYIFSDDRPWCRKNFPSNFIVVDGTSKYEDMQLMSNCKHAIIANSSFSWWAAWLGDNQSSRTVVAPKQWFVTKVVDSTDIVPERWMQI